MIIYTDIKNTFSLLSVKTRERTLELRKEAVELVKEYEKSLMLETDFWVDSKGMQHPYVDEGVDDNGTFNSRPVAAARLDNDYALNFVLKTIVDDSIRGGSAMHVNVKMKYINNTLLVCIGEDAELLHVIADNVPGRFNEVTERIKETVIDALNKRMPE